MQGLKGNEKNVETRLVFEENQLNQKLFDEEDDDLCKKTLIGEEEKRDSESVKLVLNRYSTFWRKIFNKYSCAKAAKKDYFDEQNGTMEQIDLLKLCK